ncbi:MAG TPA: DUF488 domain-containing protein [Sphingomonas sp.]|nr:DUF488 domain-containing protein [Sphingomonas sp.]
MPEPLPVHTIGHSTRTIDAFVDLLRVGEVRLVVDIRTVPRSRRNPQYNEDVLPEELAERQIGYLRIAELGGLRGKSKDAPPDLNGFWTNQSFHNYADYALSDSFQGGFTRLLDVAAERRAAIMCAEAVWWRCHRRIVADYLLNEGREVYHLMDPARAEPAKLTSEAEPYGSGLRYPAHDLFSGNFS